ncbi:MAG: DNA-directed RNA polymerase subunit beta [Deltaproteobacteria bacterium TMED58]|nr:DNA-directed RNA polymerase subunit beta [Deltaproteobacteria bacterium TMED58]
MYKDNILLTKKRISFSNKSENKTDTPDLLSVQKESFDNLIQKGLDPASRLNIGLEKVFKASFPIEDYNKRATLNYVSYRLEDPKHSESECKLKGYNYQSSIHATFQLVTWEFDLDEAGNNILETRRFGRAIEQEVYFGEIPIMTTNGAFIINGTERVIVNQLHRSPGVFFDSQKDSKNLTTTNKTSFTARIVPQDGRWLDFEFDSKDVLHVRIDRKKKFHSTLLLLALGESIEEILNSFYSKEKIIYDSETGKFSKEVNYNLLTYQRASEDIFDSSGERIVAATRRFSDRIIDKIKSAKLKTLPLTEEDLVGMFLVESFQKNTEEPEALENSLIQEITEDTINHIKDNQIKSFECYYVDNSSFTNSLVLTINEMISKSKVTSKEQAISEIYKKFRPTDPPTDKIAATFFDNMFFNVDTYRLSKVGRMKINHKLNHGVPNTKLHLDRLDIIESFKYLLALKSGRGEVDDIDHLGNRRVRTVGELIEDRFFTGVERLTRTTKEKMNYGQLEDLTPQEIVIPKSVTSVVKEFFATGQLSQFMDQTNPLSEITHKRRISALGPGGLTRERAGFEVRDVHSSHYGRICPIETPEGPNIGLISSLSTYAKINEHGFIQTPYRDIVNGKVTNNIKFLNALEEEDFVIAQANSELDNDGNFINDLISVRIKGEFQVVPKNDAQLMDVSPSQLVSVSASLIPFLEHDDANRALMGSNMQRQAVPLLRASAPLVGTGFERNISRDSGVTVLARNSGIVDYIDSSKIVIKKDKPTSDGDVSDIYTLIKFERSNQNTCWNQKPIVKKGQKVLAGDIIADGPSTEYGELALGKNITVAFMPWGGYNFEDAILISEKLAKKDTFTSLHIEEFECVSRETKLGKEEITRDIPNVNEEHLSFLDKEGVVQIGAEVKPNDILVGKISPKGETQLSPEERLLRAIFGDKAGDVKDTSLRVPPGVNGIVLDVKHLISRIGDKQDKSRSGSPEVLELLREKEQEINIVQVESRTKLKNIFIGKVSHNAIRDGRKVVIKKEAVIDEDNFALVPYSKIETIVFDNIEKNSKEIEDTLKISEEKILSIDTRYSEQIEKISKPDDLPPGVLKIIKVYVAVKRKHQVGDKMAGRHGNKGVVSRVLPEEDMPYMSDGTPVDMVLNPLGVPSRMNVGQVLETHLGLASKSLGHQIQEHLDKNHSDLESLKGLLEKIYPNNLDYIENVKKISHEELLSLTKRLTDGVPVETPIFEGVKETEIRSLLKDNYLPEDGKLILFNGQTGEPFDQRVTVGVMYMIKLHHLVEEKIHARAIGPYSLVTQQPLGGKSHFGGQRLGEMEVWALEAYGAANTLQEFLTVKSDDVIGRTRLFDSIVKNKVAFEPGIPESFNVLTNELKSLGLNVELGDKKDEVAGEVSND